VGRGACLCMSISTMVELGTGLLASRNENRELKLGGFVEKESGWVDEGVDWAGKSRGKLVCQTQRNLQLAATLDYPAPILGASHEPLLRSGLEP
jgi:hypothetical protein